jgi:cyanophycinase
MHLRSVLKDTPAWTALVGAWKDGAVVAGSSAGGMVLGDPMVDPRGGALTLGLGLINHLAVLPHYDTWSEEKAHRTVQLATGHLRIAAIDERTALIREPDGTWRTEGAGEVTVYVDGKGAGVQVLADL